jgi:hypothetical protein
VSLTLHAQQIFRTTSKSENYVQNSDGMQKNKKCMWCQWHAVSYFACSVIDTACTMHAVSLTLHARMHVVSLTPHAKYDTACTIDEWFERPWQPLKGYLSKTYLFPNCPTPPLKKYINLKGLPNKKMFVHAVSFTPHARFLRSKIDHISANSK